ncbi:MAG: hypothetical protein KF771_11930 [Burkholderiales bacterium]|nr:hypothetical protein [Burkholderiales bacterium]
MKPKSKVLGRATELVLTDQQRQKLLNATTGRGGNQSLCERVHDSIIHRNGTLVARVYDADMERIMTAVRRPDRGTWQDVFREILTANNIDY